MGWRSKADGSLEGVELKAWREDFYKNGKSGQNYHYLVDVSTDLIMTLEKRLHNNYNNLIGIVGPTGIGKSYMALSLSAQLDYNFKIAKVAFTPNRFLQLVKNCEKYSCIILDDAGLAVDSRTWHSISNRYVNYALESCRYKNQSIIFTMPTFSMIDSNARRLFHFFIYMTQRGQGRMYKMWHNDFSGNYGRKRIKTSIYNKWDGCMDISWGVVNLQKPRVELCQAYEAKKSAFLSGLYDKLSDKIEAGNEKKMRGKVEDEDTLKIIKMARAGLSFREIANVYDCSHQTIKNVVDKYNSELRNKN
jgi:hypothetical protein